ncbi:CBS domain-containing protein [Streptomyces sp. NPDC054887]
MTPVQTRVHPAATATGHHLVDGTYSDGPQVWDDMTVEVALSVMAGARAAHLIVCDGDGRRTALITEAQLTAARADGTYTDRLRLRDLPAMGGHRWPALLPRVTDHGGTPGDLALSS